MEEIYFKVISEGWESCRAGGDYRLHYGSRNKVIEAGNGTVGIMVFDSLDNAVNFINELNQELRHFIIKVKALKKPKENPEYICDSPQQGILDIFYGKTPGECAKKVPPKGTAFFEKIETLNNEIIYEHNNRISKN